jgi:hypothetical protein
MMQMPTVAGFKLPSISPISIKNVNNLWERASGKGFNEKKFSPGIWKCYKGEYICSILKNFSSQQKTKQYEQS